MKKELIPTKSVPFSFPSIATIPKICYNFVKRGLNKSKGQVDTMRIRNYMEEVVLSMIRDVLRDIGFNCCEKCVMDIIAIALNDLPTYYVVTDKGEVYTKIKGLKQQFETDVIAAIIKAAETVQAYPKHDEENKYEI